MNTYLEFRGFPVEADSGLEDGSPCYRGGKLRASLEDFELIKRRFQSQCRIEDDRAAHAKLELIRIITLERDLATENKSEREDGGCYRKEVL